jgi:tetratricopeptide (TPR) repeat protein
MSKPAVDPKAVTRGDCILASVLALITFAIFSPLLNCKFINFDDPEYVTRNPHVLRGLSLDGTRWAFTSYETYYWQPLTWLTLQLDATFSGRNPSGYHLTNVLLHAGNAALLFLALLSLTLARWRSFAAAVIFAVHPLRVESVAWIAERKDVLSVFFGFLALLAYAYYVKAPSWRSYGWVAVSLTLSLMAKPMLVTLPFLLLVLDWWPLGRWATSTARELVVEKLPLVALVIASGIVAYLGQVKFGAVAGVGVFSLSERTGNAIISYIAYLGMAAWPVDLAVFYPHPAYVYDGVGGISPWEVAGAAGLLVAVSVAATVLRKRAPYFLAGWLWYLGTLLPVIGLIQAGAQGRADRFTYFPQIGIAVAVCWGTAAVLASRPRVAAVLAAVVVLTLTWRTQTQLPVWLDSVALWEHALKTTRKSPEGLFHLAQALGEQNGRDSEAVRCYREALRLDPTYSLAHNGLGVIYLRHGEREKAKTEFEDALHFDPKLAEAHTNLGNVYDIEKDLDHAAAEHEEAVRLAPLLVDAYGNLGRVEVKRHHYQRAADCFRSQIALRPTDADAQSNLGMALLRLGQLEESLAHVNEAIRLNDRLAAAYFVKAEVLEAAGDLQGSTEFFRKAARLNPQWEKSIEERLRRRESGKTPS